MPSVLVTRPRATAEPLAAELRRLGYQAVVEPLLSIVPVDTPFPQTGTVDAVVFTSGNALFALENRRDDILSLFGAFCFCVGPRTAERATTFGFRHVRAAVGDGAELVQSIEHVLDGKKASLLHIAGRDTDDKMQRELKKRGHRVIAWPVYEAIPVTAFSAAVSNLLEGGKLDAVAVFSPRTAQVCRILLAQAGLEACCAGLAAICLSEAVASVLKPLEWRRLVAAPKPTEDALIACLQEACPVKA